MTTPIRSCLLVPLCAALLACEGAPSMSPPEGATETEAAPAAFERGPHNGRMLRDGDFALELAIFETGVPPEFRAWGTANGRPVDPERIELGVHLTRLDENDDIDFRPQGDFLRATSIVHEPHSFQVEIDASYDGRAHHWTYDSFEGRTRISPEMAHAFGLATEVAGPATLEATVALYGRITPNADRVREVSARFDGAIRAVNVALGDSVRAGQPLATVESNESLRAYTIDAPIAGVVTERNANPGEQTAGRELFTIVDISSVWAELAVFPGDRARVRIGAAVTVVQTTGDATAESTISNIDVLARTDQAVTARVVLDNASGIWVPGTLVTGEVHVESRDVPLAVKRSGLQPFRDFQVVYAQVGDEYEVRMLELGEQAGDWVEVLGGLRPGTHYVTQNSYVLKADIEKSGATHDH